MSITVGDLLKLPSLKSARLLAGQKGLLHVTSSISVLEYSEPSLLQKEILPNNEFYGSELVITAFANIKDDVDAQCAVVSRFADMGVVGIVLFYVGLFIPEVDPRLIALAEERNFPLICMPENRMDLRYSEVIYEVMEAIFRDQSLNASFVSEVLDRVARLPAQQHSVDTVLKMLRDHLRTSLILTDASGRVINAAAWPRTAVGELLSTLPQLALPPPGAEPVYSQKAGGCWLSLYRINSSNTKHMQLLLFHKEKPVDNTMQRQIAEVVQLAVNIWSRQHDDIAVTELMRAILQDEPMKIHRLSGLFQIQVNKINSMWILHCDDMLGKAALHKILSAVQNTAQEFACVIMADIYQEDLVLFLDGPLRLQDADLLYDELRSLLEQNNVPAVITRCSNLENASAIREAFLNNQDALPVAARLYPGLSLYSNNQMRFAKYCNTQLAKGEKAAENILARLNSLKQTRENEELLNTLAVYLLDCQASTSKTAQVLFLHKNTVKYRIQKASDLLGFRVNSLPEAFYIYEALALRRLLF